MTRPQTDHTTAEQRKINEIDALFSDLITAFDRHDAMEFDRRFTEDVVFTGVDGARFTNWAELHAYHQERLTHHGGGITTWYEREAIRFPSPDVAVVAVRQPIDTAAGSRANVGTWVLIRRAGQWWVCAMQNTGVTAAHR
ncbi:YybH family protein [Rhodococcus pyridinivorans]|uniref:YybH family protein n=1 Tax=Rhodococcus pyridinivorans TaxID=103816 RepID=UPI000BA23561|nr:SgcJ/EcaC family oxidoreductase [Rhodococcus pyridinivorans]